MDELITQLKFDSIGTRQVVSSRLRSKVTAGSKTSQHYLRNVNSTHWQKDFPAREKDLDDVAVSNSHGSDRLIRGGTRMSLSLFSKPSLRLLLYESYKSCCILLSGISPRPVVKYRGFLQPKHIANILPLVHLQRKENLQNLL